MNQQDIQFLEMELESNLIEVALELEFPPYTSSILNRFKVSKILFWAYQYEYYKVYKIISAVGFTVYYTTKDGVLNGKFQF